MKNFAANLLAILLLSAFALPASAQVRVWQGTLSLPTYEEGPPDPNPPSPPPGVEIRGNVYRIGCVAQPGGAPVTLGSSYHVTLRFPPGAFKEIQFDDGQGWRTLTTLRSPGGDPYASVNAPGFGEYAATAPTGAAASGDSILTILARYAPFYGILAFVILFGAIAVVQELRRRRRRAPPRRKKRS